MANRLMELFKLMFDEEEDDMDEKVTEKPEVSGKVREKICALCDELEVNEDVCSGDGAYGNLQSARILCDYMLGDMRTMTERVGLALNDVYEESLGDAADEMFFAAETYRKLAADMDKLGGYIRATAAALRSKVRPDDWELLYTEEELQRVLEERFVPDSDMFVAYRAGEYAFIFRQNDEESEPFIFARGSEDSYPAIEVWLNRLIDIDEVVEEVEG